MKTRLYIRLWWWARGKAIAAIKDEFPAEYRGDKMIGMTDDETLNDAFLRLVQDYRDSR